MPPKQYKTIEEFLGDLDPALRPLVDGIREAVLSASPDIQEGIKWNGSSFYVTEYFATINVRPTRSRPGVMLVLHTGAKLKPSPGDARATPDPLGLLEWLAPDRAVLRLGSVAELAERRAALIEIVQGWVASMAAP